MAQKITVDGTVTLTREEWMKVRQYRDRRKQERGRSITTSTAISELLETALSGIEPPKPLEDRLDSIERRLYLLEVRSGGEQQ